METDPFDNVAQTDVYPFLAVLYFTYRDPMVLWNDNHLLLIDAVLDFLNSIEDPHVIYAHNGGRFDYRFFLKGFRGFISFKGGAVMRANIGKHELRDSFHIIPTKLASYRKDEIDYDNFKRERRALFRRQIEDYCIADCRYLMELVQDFVRENGLKLSIGQASLALLRKEYKVKSLKEGQDASIRPFYRGGRVECLQGRGIFNGDFTLFDVNSMYPFVMAACLHPCGNNFIWRNGEPNSLTAFVEMDCIAVGCFPFVEDTGEVTFPKGRGVYKVSIHEYLMALKYGLFNSVRSMTCIDCDEFSRFDRFVIPMYENRQRLKKEIDRCDDAAIKSKLERTDLFFKFFLNNAYGKFGQNPREFKESFACEPGHYPDIEPDSWPRIPRYSNERIAIFERPSKHHRYYNVATAASITGAARAVLMHAITFAIDPVYCDTDSIICKGFRDGSGLVFDKSALGAWDETKIEGSTSIKRIAVAGKKDYALLMDNGREYVRCKGVDRMTRAEIEMLVEGAKIPVTLRAPTIDKLGNQKYLTREKVATAKRIA